MGRLRSWLGREFRRVGLIQPVADQFTATQMMQLRTVATELCVATSAVAAAATPASEFTSAQLEQLRELFGATINEAGERWSAQAPAPPERTIVDLYASAAPSPQLAIDIFAGDWSAELPKELGVISGQVNLFSDTRIDRVLEWLGSAVTDLPVLELGPLEGGHTYMLDLAGADVLAIESNSRAFLKCLIVKELLDLKRARFVRGDFIRYLQENTDRFGLVLASGVLYHMIDPVELLQLIAAAADRVVIWTHYFDADILTRSPMQRQFQTAPLPTHFGEATYRLHRRDYLEAVGWGGFCGGPEPYAHWMERADILDCLHRLGFSDITISHDDPNHPNGPSFLLLARRPQPPE